MRIDILTLFPDSMQAMLGESILGRAAKKGVIDIHCTQIRDYTENKQMQVDDYPYGGGWGCVMMAQPLKSCLDDVMARAGERRSRVIYMSPQGKPFNQEEAKRLGLAFISIPAPARGAPGSTGPGLSAIDNSIPASSRGATW